MKNVIEHNLCTGCTACFNICPNNAISMLTDEQGFSFPQIDEKKCVKCGLCVNICPVKNTSKNETKNMCYAAYNNDIEIRKNSSSGGVFYSLAKEILDQSGIVIGATFDNQLHLVHKVIYDYKEISLLMGSKYIQSDLNDIFKYIQSVIEDKMVLFVGTPCQVAGLRAFLKKDYEKLICIDLICHGVPSPKLFSKYINEIAKRNNAKVINYNFRDKCSGWENYSNTVSFENDKFTQLHKNNAFMKLFLSDSALRESCYNCKFKLENKYSDITLGDFWGVSKIHYDMYNSQGVSAVILNTEKGVEIFEKIKKEFKFKQCCLDDIVSCNPALKTSMIRPKKRDEFFFDMENFSIDELVKKYEKKVNFLKKVLNKIKSIIYKKIQIKKNNKNRE